MCGSKIRKWGAHFDSLAPRSTRSYAGTLEQLSILSANALSIFPENRNRTKNRCRNRSVMEIEIIETTNNAIAGFGNDDVMVVRGASPLDTRMCVIVRRSWKVHGR
jgi:hypothetical protein